MDWTTPADLHAQLQRLWDRGDLLRARLEGENTLFPLQLRLKKPGSQDLGTRFEAVRRWIQQLQSAEQRYRLAWREVNHRQLGRNLIPDGVQVETLEDALHLLGKSRAAQRFDGLVASGLTAFPALRPWLVRHPLRALEQGEHWHKVLAALHWFHAHPHSGLYLRQLDIPGVDTKFIEQRKGLLAELLDLALPAEHIMEDARGARSFSRRYGLRDKPVRLRLRVLDPALAISGLTDLELPVEQFASLRLSLEQVFVTENETNALAFPDIPRSILLFGQGYALDRLGQIPWLEDQPLYYWGDIDTHGFAMLNRLRTYLPHARSLLMDSATLHQHHELWGREPADKRCTSELPHLTASEQELYIALRDNRLSGPDGQPAEHLRFEQEHVRFNWLQRHLRQL